jgi:hypothetical protein
MIVIKLTRQKIYMLPHNAYSYYGKGGGGIKALDS